MSDDVIRFSAQVFKVATTIDGGIRLTLDMNTDPQTMTALIQAKQPGIILECACLAIKPEETIKPIDDTIDRRELTRNPLYAKQ